VETRCDGETIDSGGNVALSTAKQTISLAAEAGDVRSGAVHYAFGAWLGGFASQGDNAVVTLSFLDAHGARIGGARLTVEERRISPANLASDVGDP